MTISGFSYVRNGFDYGVPFIEAIQSVLPICDEFVIAVGDSLDGTREAIEAIASPKIKIIDTVWDINMKTGGKTFAQQTNIALDNTTGNWAFHVQADEVIHEKSLPIIKAAIEQYNNDSRVDGFIFPFLHFWGDYYHIRNSRRVHKYEVRLFKNNKLVRSYKDSQGFRKYKSVEEYDINERAGKKLNVKKIEEPIYHYNGVRTEKNMAKKSNNFKSFYGETDFSNEPAELFEKQFNLHWVDRVAPFTQSHPSVMKHIIEKNDFRFLHDKSKAVWRKSDRLLQPIEDWLGFKFGEYKNYKIV